MLLIPFLLASILLLFLQAHLNRMTVLVPDFGLLLAVYLGLFARREWISLGAGGLGLLRAAVCLEPAGAVVLILLVTAHAVSFFRDALFRERIVTQWVVAFAAGALYLVLHVAVSLLVPGIGVEGVSGVPRIMMATLLATLLAPGVFGLLRLCRVGP